MKRLVLASVIMLGLLPLYACAGTMDFLDFAFGLASVFGDSEEEKQAKKEKEKEEKKRQQAQADMDASRAQAEAMAKAREDQNRARNIELCLRQIKDKEICENMFNR